MQIRAWYFASDSGYLFSQHRMAPRLGLRFDATRGDKDPSDGELNTFSSPFAATSYSGLSGLIGPSNIMDFAPSLSFSPHRPVERGPLRRHPFDPAGGSHPHLALDLPGNAGLFQNRALPRGNATVGRRDVFHDVGDVSLLTKRN